LVSPLFCLVGVGASTSLFGLGLLGRYVTLGISLMLLSPAFGLQSVIADDSVPPATLTTNKRQTKRQNQPSVKPG